MLQSLAVVKKELKKKNLKNVKYMEGVGSSTITTGGYCEIVSYLSGESTSK